MNIYRFTSIFSFMQNAMAYIEINGELTFDLNADGDKNLRVRDNNKAVDNKPRDGAATAAVDVHSTESKEAVKTGSEMEDCVYKYPERKQLEALQSDLMNQLTKIFVRAYQAVGGREVRRGSKRFKIANETFDSRFFERAYNHMSKEYSKSVNSTVNISRLSSHDPCHHQAEVRQMWRDLLKRSKAVLKRAAVSCISGLLVRHRAGDDRTKEKMEQLLRREIKELRANQLKVLCDNFKLCYKDLL